MTYSLADMEDVLFPRRIRDALKPCGIAVVEQMNAGGTDKLRVIHYEDVVDTAEWSLRRMRIGRIVAQKD